MPPRPYDDSKFYRGLEALLERTLQVLLLGIAILMPIAAVMAITPGLPRDRRLLNELKKLPAEQQVVAKRIMEHEISKSEVRRNILEFNGAREALEGANKSLEAKDARRALDNIINAKGHIEKINPLVFDTKEMMGLIRETEKQIGRLLGSAQ